MEENEVERMNAAIATACCRWKGIKEGVVSTRTVDEFHPIKDWFREIPNDTAKEFAVWLLDLAKQDLDSAIEEMTKPTETSAVNEWEKTPLGILRHNLVCALRSGNEGAAITVERFEQAVRAEERDRLHEACENHAADYRGVDAWERGYTDGCQRCIDSIVIAGEEAKEDADAIRLAGEE